MLCLFVVVVTHTCVVGLQDALESLPVVVTTETQLFVDVVGGQLQLGILVVLDDRLADLSVEGVQGGLLQEADPTWSRKTHRVSR